MKRTILIVMILALLPTVRAQRIHAYLAGGFTLAQVEGDELKGFKKWGGSGGVGAIMNITDNGKWRFGVEVDFDQRGFKNKTKNPYNINLTLNYIDIPVSFYFHDNRGGITVGAGLMYGRLVQQPHGQLDYPADTFVPDTTDMSWLKNDVAVQLEFRFTVWRGLQLNLRWQYSLLPIKKDWTFTEYRQAANPDVWSNNCYNHAITARIIYEFGTEDNGGRSSHKRRRR